MEMIIFMQHPENSWCTDAFKVVFSTVKRTLTGIRCKPSGGTIMAPVSRFWRFPVEENKYEWKYAKGPPANSCVQVQKQLPCMAAKLSSLYTPSGEPWTDISISPFFGSLKVLGVMPQDNRLPVACNKYDNILSLRNWSLLMSLGKKRF